MSQRKQAEFTGRHMAIIMVAFFAVIFAVNLTMATLARTSWTGLVVQNTYVASQEFNGKVEESRARAALGWTGTVTISRGAVGYRLEDADGRAVPLFEATMALRRPVSEAEDIFLTLRRTADGLYAARAPVADGVWIVDVTADAGLDLPYRDVRRVSVRGGELR